MRISSYSRWGWSQASRPVEPIEEPSPASVADNRFYEELIASKPALIDEKVKLHGKIIDEFNLSMMDKVSIESISAQIRPFVTEYVKSERIVLNQKELEAFIDEIIDEMTGLGPIEPLLKDPTVNDILINTHMSVYVERYGQLEPTSVRFKDEAHLLRIIGKIVAGVGRRVDESSPTVDARLPDGSRVNVAVRPVAVDGPLVSIRKFSKRPFSMDRLVDIGALRPPMAEVLRAAVQGRISIIVSGGTGSGKTTMLNALSSYISPKERLITIEDAAELQLQQPHVGRLETRPPNAEGKGEIRQRELVKNALRMRPDRIIIGEVRGDEAFDMLQAMNTGHEGSMTTIHANNPRDAMRRLEQMVGMAGMPMSITSIRAQIASAINLVVQLQRLADGKRRMISVSEITGMEGDVIQMQEIYRFVREGLDQNGGIVGSYRATGIRPNFLKELKSIGIDIPGNYFDPTQPL
ncbi:CpaF family protein [Chelatococcus sp. SYSU_G07232]|uniref:CpaF family protein n=1 Tax=Chelatococcus albus TaxID=3047466 RepID=A0ABT7AIK6_9HYPH|nr:CpaF family protein [Chelatococcus sp. SYSU_G07232]MDJ1159212.1 CpaF family protein [Chelatococcus sp. SYSU_G07232]